MILTLLSKYKKEQAEEILRLMFNKLKQLPKYTSNPSRFINKLLLLSTLRNLDETITKKIKSMPIFTEAMIKNHALYKEGKEEGRELGLEEGKEERKILREEAEKKEVQAIINLYTDGVGIKIIAKALNITQKRIKEVIAEWKEQSPKK